MAKSRLTQVQDAQRRVDAATREFAALLQRHKVQWTIEQGESGLTGKFTRLLFYLPLGKQTDEAPKS